MHKFPVIFYIITVLTVFGSNKCSLREKKKHFQKKILLTPKFGKVVFVYSWSQKLQILLNVDYFTKLEVYQDYI